MAQRSSRKKRKERQRTRTEAAPVAEPETEERASGSADFMARGYARGRARDDAARAALEPLGPGERPGAVTVAFVVAVVAAIANLVALAINFDSDKGPQTTFTILVCILLVAMAAGMWRARYWAVLGMQTLLGITVLLASLGLISAVNVPAALLLLVIIVAAGTLFWFLVKAMARIQMPERPGARD
ncbi:MAG TPA: hypothetical protein VEX39_09485 [Thermoleophilaceae bacterium]|nr:hypothetical protein [Thermoleophilaceae bacterium]